MKCRMFYVNRDTNFNTEEDVNNWLEEIGPIVIDHVTSTHFYLFIFYSTIEK